MSKKIYGDLNVSKNTTSYGKNTIRDVNNINADQNGEINLPIYKKDYINKIISTLPVSRVGTMDYLPLNINGAFVGSSGYIGKGVYPTILENDGTFVYIRAGTNGSTGGYYYAYVPNARNVTTMSPVITNELYRPSIFTPSHKLNKFISTNAGELLMMLANNGTQDTYILTLTNGTLSTVAHQNMEFPKSAIPDTDPQYAVIHGSNVYIFGIDSYSNASVFAISVYSIAVSDVVNGVYTSLAKVTGFSGADLYANSVSASANIKLTSKIFSADVTEQPLYNIPTGNTYRSFNAFWGNTDGSLHAVSDGANNIRVAFYHTCEVSTQQQSSRNASGFSLVLNTSSKAYTFDNNGLIAPCIITTNTAGAITYTNPFFVNWQTQIVGLTANSSLNRVPTFYITSDGVQFASTSRHDSSPEHYEFRSNITNFTSLYEAWNMNTRALSNTILTTVNPVFGSPIGENLIHPSIISGNKVLLHCSGNSDGVFFGYDSSVTTELGSSRDYVYNSVTTGGTINGYAPNANRILLDNSDFKYTGLISIVDNTGSTAVYGTSFIEGVTKTSGGLLDPVSMTFTDSYTLSSASILTDLKNNMLNSVTQPYNVIDSKIVLYYVPDGSYTKSFALITGRNDAPVGTINSFLILSEVDVTVTGTTITELSITSSRLISRGIVSASLNTGLMGRNGGMIIANYADFTYVGIPGLFSTATSGAGNYCSILCKADNSTKLISTATRIDTAYNSSLNNTYEVGVLPNVGFGLFENGDITDIKTKLIFKNFGTTSAQFDAMQTNPALAPIERIVVASQEVAQGYIVYFTQEVPVLLAGKYSMLPVTNIDLNTIDSSPANKTFYIYIVSTAGVASYLISTTALTEELDRVYIGTAITGASGITSIVSEKVTRFLTYRPSVTKRGSAIPASTGVPSGTGTRWS